jgi:hypothetical protein
MPTTVQEVLDEARQVYLNDAAVDIFTNGLLLPFAKRAYDELQNKLALNGHQIAEEVSATIDVPANTLVMPSLPTYLIEPTSLEERADGSVSNADWAAMDKVDELPLIAPGDTLRFWRWQENEIKLVGSVQAREVRLKYTKFQAAIIDVSTSMPIINCKPYLSARVAALAAGHIGGNKERAMACQADAENALSDLLGISTKGEQNLGVRRRPFRGRG